MVSSPHQWRLTWFADGALNEAVLSSLFKWNISNSMPFNEQSLTEQMCYNCMSDSTDFLFN